MPKAYKLTLKEIGEATLPVRPPFTDGERIVYAAQRKLVEYLNGFVLYTGDGEIGTGEDCNIMLCLTPKMWQSLLKDFRL